MFFSGTAIACGVSILANSFVSMTYFLSSVCSPQLLLILPRYSFLACDIPLCYSVTQ
jgi:hypothetical protein